MAKSLKQSRASLAAKKKSKKKSEPAGGKQLTKQEMLNRTVHFFEQNSSQAYNYKQIAFEIGVSSMTQKRQLIQLLEDLVLQEFLISPASGKYRIDNRTGAIVGKLERRTGGKIFLVPSEGGEDIFIMDKYMNKAIVGDTVRVRLFARRT